MTVASAAASKTKKIMKLTLLLLRRGFDSGKCKTAAKMTVARIKLLRNKRQAVVKQMRRDIAMLLESGQDATARIRVEHVIREQNILAANEFIELFCELIVARLQIISKQRECPADLKEGIASVIFAAPRCSDIPELGALKDVFGKKYGKEFVAAATELRPACGVNRMLIDKLSVRTPTGETKLKVMKEIASEYQVEWDTTESEIELLKPPEEKIEGPKDFVSAASVPLKPVGTQTVDPMKQSARVADSRETVVFQDSASAAEAAAESAKQAIAAAQAAAYLASREKDHNLTTTTQLGGRSDNDVVVDDSGRGRVVNRRHSYNNNNNMEDSEFDDVPQRMEKGWSGGGNTTTTTTASNDNDDDEKIYRRRYSYNDAPSSDIKFDDSDYDEEIEIDKYPSATATAMPPHRVHPKLPDYEDLAARFDALKFRK